MLSLLFNTKFNIEFDIKPDIEISIMQLIGWFEMKTLFALGVRSSVALASSYSGQKHVLSLLPYTIRDAA